MSALPAGVYAIGLSLLPGAGPVSLGRLLADGDPERAWADVLAGRSRRPAARQGAARDRIGWDVAARHIDLAACWAQARSSATSVTWVGSHDFPVALRRDPLPPAVLFWRGSLEALGGPCVALVGTRHATPEGRATAFEMGRDLAAAGVCVISGLALGIDGAAHRGAVRTDRPGATIGIAASGADRVYPTRHHQLWTDVIRLGAVISETPPGHPAQTWRFPARNRIIAGLVSMVVVVESHAAGGSLITADAAIQRGIDVRAVPGPVGSPASAGTNQLLFDGPGPVRDATDVLIALGTKAPARPPGVTMATRPLDRRGRSGAAPEGRVRVRAPRPDPVRAVAPTVLPGAAPLEATILEATPLEATVLETMGRQARTLNWIVAHVPDDHGITAIAAALDRLAATGTLTEEHGWWRRHH